MTVRTVDECWDELVTTALLGTDRRPPPEPPQGPVADVVADLAIVAGDNTPDARYLNQVAAVALARRVALRPGAPVATLAPPPDDDRPLCARAAAAQWRRLVDEWPVLEDEWLAIAAARDERLPGDLLIDLLERHRNDVRRRQLVERIAGAVASWTCDHVTRGAPPPVRPPMTASSPGDATPLPELPQHPALIARVGGGDHADVVAVVRGKQFGATDRRLVEHVIARCDPAALPALADALARAVDDVGGGAAASMLCNLARQRMAMRASFEL